MRLYKKIFFLLIVLYPGITNAVILFNDPEFNKLNTELSKYSKDDLVNITGKNKNVKIYIAALLYLDGNSNLNIKQNCVRAKKMINKSKDLGIVDAEYILFTMYYRGDCVKKDMRQARSFLESSSSQGFIRAERDIGLSYWGKYIPGLYKTNMDKAIYWLKKAANDGDSRAASYLSYIYKEGISGVDVNYDKAFKWKYTAAHPDKSSAIGRENFLTLAPYYEKGLGTKVNLVQAYKYYTLSGSAGSEGKYRVAKQMTPEQIKEGERLAQEWMDKNGIHVPSY